MLLSTSNLGKIKALSSRTLARMSAHPYPEAIEVPANFFSLPFFLSQSPAYDILFVIDLGILRRVPDGLFKIHSTSECSAHGRKAYLNRIANFRFIDLASGCTDHRRSIFLRNKTSAVRNEWQSAS